MSETKKPFQSIAEEWPEMNAFEVTSPELAKEIERRWNNFQSLLDACTKVVSDIKHVDEPTRLESHALKTLSEVIRKAEQ